MQKRKIAVIFGGCSPEYEVSLQSAYSVITHIDHARYEPILLGITRAGEWFRFSGALEKIRNDTWSNSADCVRAIISPSRETQGVLIFETDNKISTVKLDAAMPVLHGKNGEDGTMQGMLELAGIPIIGCNTLASALCMDKDRAHKIAEAAGVCVSRSFTITDELDASTHFGQAKHLGYPLFVKPVRAGSSYGITKVLSEGELADSIRFALQYDDAVIVEEAVTGFEVGCAVLGTGSNVVVGDVDEIELTDGFFDHKEKYTLETSAIHVPARISLQKANEMKETAKIIYKALGCSSFARVDMFLTPAGEILFNEVNTIPGFTAHSRYPNMLKAAGMPFERVIHTLIEQAVKS